MVTDNTSASPSSTWSVFDGSECGRIISTDTTLLGRRVVHNGQFGTIRFAGELPGTSGTWLGVDWDSPDRGRHDGSYRGKRYFATTTNTSGSFVKPQKVSLGTSLEEALSYRYVLCPECQLSARIDEGNLSMIQSAYDPTDISANIKLDGTQEELEFTGRTHMPVKVELYTTPGDLSDQSHNRHRYCGPQGVKVLLPKLRSATLALMPIYRGLKSTETATALWPENGDCLRKYAPHLDHLDLSGCLLTRWVELAEICVQLPALTSLNVSHNHLRLPRVNGVSLEATDEYSLRSRFDLDAEFIASEILFKRAFLYIRQLILVRCVNLDWHSLLRLLPCFPSLMTITLAYNKLGNIPSQVPSDTLPIIHRLTEVDLTETDMTDLKPLFVLFGPSSALTSLVLNQNPIESLPEFPVIGTATSPFTPTTWFPSLNLLGFRDTNFKDWKPLHQLLRLPHLKHLFLANCPVMTAFDGQTARQEVIARLPDLSILNRIEICSDERRGAELDYLKRYGAQWRKSTDANADSSAPSNHATGDPNNKINVDPSFTIEHPVFDKLCEKWGIPDLVETKFAQTLKEGLTEITFILQSPTSANEQRVNPTTSRRIHGRMTVNHLRMMIRRLFKIQPRTTFDLVSQGERHKRLNQEIPLDADTREIGFYSLEDGDIIYVRLHK